MLHPTKCSVDGWYSSNWSYENIKSTEVTARNVYKSVKQSEFPLVLGQKTVLKHVFETDKACLFQTKTICTQNQNTPLLIFFFPLACYSFLLSLNNWKQITDIYLGTHFLCLQFKNVHFFQIQQLYWSRCMQAKCSAHKQKALQVTTRAFTEIFAAVCLFFKKETEMVPAAAVFKYCVYSILCRTARISYSLPQEGQRLFPPHTIETFWQAIQ